LEFSTKSFDGHNTMEFSAKTSSSLDGDSRSITTIRIKDEANTNWELNEIYGSYSLKEFTLEMIGDSEASMLIDGLRYLAEEIERQIDLNKSK
jgi:hypothetical protein